MARRSIIFSSHAQAVEEVRTCADKQNDTVVEGSTIGDETCSIISSLSSENEDEGITQHEPQGPRSIFCSYWEKEAVDRCTMKQNMTRNVRPQSPAGIMSIDPYQHFGLLEEEDDSLNTYEQTLRRCEVTMQRTPHSSRISHWASMFSNSYSLPSLRRQTRTLGPHRAAQSDSALVTPLKSALRNRRFGNPNCPPSPPVQSRVSFQPVVKVCSFKPPVESWAAEGWSSWFGDREI